MDPAKVLLSPCQTLHINGYYHPLLILCNCYLKEQYTENRLITYILVPWILSGIYFVAFRT